MEILKVLENGIIKVFDKFGNEIPFTKKEVKMYKARHSSTGRECRCLFLDDIPLVNLRDKKYHVLFRCECGNISTIHLSKYLEKNKLTCTKCRENEEKIAWHKKYFEMRRNGLERGHRNTSHTRVKYDFDGETEEYKKQYFENNLTEKEFNFIKNKLYSVEGVKIEGKKISFIPHEPCFNAKKYTQAILIDGEKHRFKDINLKCDCCGKVYHITRQLKEKINNGYFLCKNCAFVNLSFSVKKYSENLTYQSLEEFDFIERCLKNDIKIKDAEGIHYYFNGRLRVYYPDFLLPEENKLIEIKDNHVWHRKQVESGKWGAKEKAALKYCEERGLTYYLLFPNDIDNFFENILKR